MPFHCPNRLAVRTLAIAFLLSPSAQIAWSEALESTPFAPASTSNGDTLFSRLNPEETNIIVDNAYDDPLMWGKRYREYMGGSMGSGIAAGDFDGDGYIDLYVSLKTKPGRLFRNLGNWKFEDITEEAGLSEEGSLFSWLSSDDEIVWRHGAIFADVDNDGQLDLYVCRNGAPNFLYINQGDGTFKEEAESRGLGISDGSVIGAFADYDRDGWLDVLLLTNQMDGTEPSGRADRLFRNTGNGHFVETTLQAGIDSVTFGHSVTWFDFDHDQWPDFYIANDYVGPDYLYRNNGDGTFSNVIDQVLPHSSYSSMGIDIGDVDNNGFEDLFIGDMAATTREREHRRKPPASKEDLLKMGDRPHTAPQYTRNSLLLNTGLNYFREAACWAGIDATDWTWSVRLEDFDNDGWLDLHITNGMVREANNSDLLSTMMKARSLAQRVAVMSNSPRLEESNLAFRNKNGQGFEPVTKKWGLDESDVSFGAATADFDNDGDLDIVYLNHDGGVSVYRNDVSHQNALQVRLRGKRSNSSGIGAVVRLETKTGTQSRTLSSARGYASGSDLVAHFGIGSETTANRLTVEWPSGAKQTYSNLEAGRTYTIEEEENDVQPTATTTTPLFADKTDDYGLRFSDKSRLAIPDTEQVLLPFRTDRAGPGIAVADVDSDGKDDLYVATTPGSPARLLRWKEGVYIQEVPSGILDSTIEDGPPLIFDADENGTRDLLVTKASADLSAWPQAFQPVFFSNDGNGNFTSTDWLPKLEINVGAAVAADIDGDGDLDLFLGARSLPGLYPETPTSALLRSDKGTFNLATKQSPDLEKVGLVKSALFRDVDTDGHPDLILALEWDTVRYFHNTGEGTFEDWTERTGFDSGLRGWWNGLTAGDFNNDGKLDFAVGNLGLNTTYKASPEKPATLYYGTFGASAQRVIVEAAYEGDTLYPLRSRGDLGSRLTHALRRFPRSDDYAKASLLDVFGERALSAAERFEADNFLSGVFLSQVDGRYHFSPFPPEAQIGPILGLVAEDFDGDGDLDLFASQNTDIATPSFHGGVGLLLKGKGDGQFEALEPNVSGILLPGNGRAAAVLDARENGSPSLFMTRLRGESVYLENTASKEARWLAIRLIGSVSNRDAIGAKLMLRYQDGSTRIHEIGLGGSWMSQESPLVWVANGVQKLESISVRWPDGDESEFSEFPDSGIWEILK